MQNSFSIQPYGLSPFTMACVRQLQQARSPRDVAQAVGVLAVVAGVWIALDHLSR